MPPSFTLIQIHMYVYRYIIVCTTASYFTTSTLYTSHCNGVHVTPHVSTYINSSHCINHLYSFTQFLGKCNNIISCCYWIGEKLVPTNTLDCICSTNAIVSLTMKQEQRSADITVTLQYHLELTHPIVQNPHYSKATCIP